MRICLFEWNGRRGGYAEIQIGGPVYLYAYVLTDVWVSTFFCERKFGVWMHGLEFGLGQ